MRLYLGLATALMASACVANQQAQFVPSSKPALELRAAQTRLVPGDTDTVMRGVIATLHDLGYRITKVEPGAGTVSATRQTALRMAVAVRSRTPVESVVRANATIVALNREAQVDSPMFYRDDFFTPLGAMMARNVIDVPEDVTAPDAVQPTAELNVIKARETAAKQAAKPAVTSPATGTKPQ